MNKNTGIFIIDDEIAEPTPEQKELIARHARSIMISRINYSRGGYIEYSIFTSNAVEIDNPTQKQLAESWEWLSEQNFAQRWAKDGLCGKMLNQKYPLTLTK